MPQPGIGVGNQHGLGDLQQPIDEARGPVTPGPEGIDHKGSHAHFGKLRAIGQFARTQNPRGTMQQHDSGDGFFGAGLVGHEQNGPRIRGRVQRLALADLP